MIDFSVDGAGVLIVRNCGCGKHGLISTWTDHSEEWQSANAAHARRVIGEFRARWPERVTALDSAAALVRKSEREVT